MFWINTNRKLHSDKNDEDLKKRGRKAPVRRCLPCTEKCGW